MGWASCGTDSEGRPIGYAHAATCDHPGCTAGIHRGIDYACGGMHGGDDVSCDRYFCSDHRLTFVQRQDGAGEHQVRVCDECADALLAAGWTWGEGADEDVLMPPREAP